jgi:hypothetical protein
LTDLVVGQSVSRQLTAQGGSEATYKFRVTSGTLPNGLTLSYSGLVSGTPTVASSGTVEIMAVDDAGFIAFATFSVVVGTGSTGSPGSLAFSQATATFAEGATATITLTRTGGTSGSVSVSIRVADENIGNRQSGIAVKGVDYSLPATVITFADGQASQTFQIPIALDQLIEQHETFTLVIDQPTGGATLGQQQTSVVTILSRDGTSTQRYVAQAFQDLLKRTVDGGGLSYWSGLIDQGAPRSLISKMLTHSDEYFATNVIKPSYSQFLNREADQTGLDYWTQQLQSGVTDEQMQAGFIASNEFFNNSGGTDLLWIRGLYQALLGRLPDQTGEN